MSRQILDGLFGPRNGRVFDVRFWEGTLDTGAEDFPPRFVLVLCHPGALRRAFFPPTTRAMGEAFVRGDIEIEGDVEAAAALADETRAQLASPAVLMRLLAGAARLPRRAVAEPAEEAPSRAGTRRGLKHSRRRDAAAVRNHYDVGNDFFRLFLDERLQYSCGYFAPGVDGLDAAQEAKLEHICRKLRLKPGEKLLDIGCGWGGLIQYAAERFGVDALGITLSRPQAELARRRIAAAGMERNCRVEVRDYRDLPREARFEKIVSVGMVEHVGRAMMSTYFRETSRLLAPGGLFLNHGITSLSLPPTAFTRLMRAALGRQTSFIQRFVFPDSELVTTTEVVGPGEAVGLELRDLESLREHYAITLRHWVRRLEEREAEAVAVVGEATYRVWRLYMGASAHQFASGRIGIVQSLWGKQMKDGSLALPATRDDLYRTGAVAPVPRGPFESESSWGEPAFDRLMEGSTR